MTFYAKACGSELARAHARAGDAIAIASYLGTNDTFDRALALFAESYADQNERDYDTLHQGRQGREHHGRDGRLARASLGSAEG